jgi:adenosine deaminase
MLADCHLHFEGSLPSSVVAHLAGRDGHAFADPAAFAARRAAISGPAGFLELYAEVCRLFRSPEDYRAAAQGLAQALAADGVGYAEVYVSPEICSKIGLDAAACLEAVDVGFSEGRGAGGADCRILLDTVRHWGAEAAFRVLDLHERRPLERVVGFGMGGDEASVPAAEFAGAYARARALGLSTSVHAGEWRGADSVREALDSLRPDRLDHGISAASDPALLVRLADERITLWVAPSGNIATGAVGSFAEHPLARLLDAGVSVALSADDPLLFATTTAGEYELAGSVLGLSRERLGDLAARAWRAAFGLSHVEREAGAGEASSRFRTQDSIS